MEEKWKKVNPVLPLDYPDPDVIRDRRHVL